MCDTAGMKRSFVCVWVGTLLVFGACSSAAQSSQQSPSDTVATVGTTSITLAEVDALALTQPAADFGSLTLGQALYESRRATLERMVGDMLIEREAASLTIDTAVLIDREVTAHIVPTTGEDVQAWYDNNPARVQGATLDQVEGPIRQLLEQERQMTARREYVTRLREKTPVRILLEPPRVEVTRAGRPVRGPEDAPVEIIEFSDFECPFCQRAYPTVNQVLDTYGDRVRLVYRHYPLPSHPNARPAAEAALCAEAQDKFWEYHDRLFASSAKLSVPDLKQHAADLGLDTAAFDTCLDSGQYRTELERDIAAGNVAGVSGTPAFFINGRPLSGAQPFEAFKRVIDEELERNAQP